MQQLGNSWTAVGAYNAGKPALRIAYAKKVYRNLPRAAIEAQP
jgi:soluble lytic murein transglycosylase-like protein